MKKYVCNDKMCYLDTGKQSIPSGNRPTNFPFPSKNSGWVVYGAEWCKYCKNAVTLLGKSDVSFVYYDINIISIGGTDNLTYNLKPLIGDYNTIPIIFYNDVFIGGYTDLLKHFTPPNRS